MNKFFIILRKNNFTINKQKASLMNTKKILEYICILIWFRAQNCSWMVRRRKNKKMLFLGGRCVFKCTRMFTSWVPHTGFLNHNVPWHNSNGSSSIRRILFFVKDYYKRWISLKHICSSEMFSGYWNVFREPWGGWETLCTALCLEARLLICQWFALTLFCSEQKCH